MRIDQGEATNHNRRGRLSPIGRSSDGPDSTQGRTQMDKYDAHCEQPGCICDHTKCYKGWIDNTIGTWPCMYCRENLLTRMMNRDAAKAKGYPQPALHRIATKTST